MTDKLRVYSSEILPAIEEEMKTVMRWDPLGSEDRLFDLMHYHLGWRDQNMQALSAKGGKRIRPLLLLLCCAAAGGSWRRALPAAAAVELLHNFTLIHDDVEDDSPLRRGRPTIWKLQGIPQSINIGDSMFALSHLALLRLTEQDVPMERILWAMKRFDETCLWLTQGQHADMHFEGQVIVSVNEYIEMISGKTAALLSLAAELGAMIAGRDDDIVEHFRQYGLGLGLAFQVKDDILGIWGDESTIGKSAATDIVTRKKTLPVLFALQESSALRELYLQADSDANFVQEVVCLLDVVGARGYAERMVAEYSENSLAQLSSVDLEGSATTALYQLTDKLFKREF